MSLTKEDLQAIGALMDAKLEPVITKMESEISELRTEMREGFKHLELCINLAAKDAARTEELLQEHIQQPMH